MEKRKLFSSLTMTALTLVVLCLLLVTATYAWFTFDPYTNVTPMEGKISKGDANLLISEKKTGPFAKQCDLNPTDLAKALYPVSTPDLTKFYASTAQDRDGYSVTFQDVTAKPGEWLIHGTVYLQCLGSGCDVFFDCPPLDLGSDAQVLAAGRLGLIITGGDGKAQTFLFKLDSMGSTAGAKQRPTVHRDNAVISGIDASGGAKFADDPAVSIGEYRIDASGAKKLCTMQSDEIATVEYWLYLEGCDPECYNPVQSKDVTLQLGFAGNPVKN